MDGGSGRRIGGVGGGSRIGARRTVSRRVGAVRLLAGQVAHAEIELHMALKQGAGAT